MTASVLSCQQFVNLPHVLVFPASITENNYSTTLRLGGLTLD